MQVLWVQILGTFWAIKQLNCPTCLHPGAFHLHWDVTFCWRIFTYKSGLPCGSPSSSLLQTWLLIKALTESVNSAVRGVSVCFSNLHISKHKKDGWFSSCPLNSFSFREPQEVFPALLPALLVWQINRFSSSFLMLPLFLNHPTYFSGSEVAASLCGVALPHGDPQAGLLYSYECPQELSCLLHGCL